MNSSETVDDGRAARSGRAALAEALRNASYEVLPFKSTEEKVLAHVPRDVALTVTSTEARGLDPTLDIAGRLARDGYSAAPHVAARLVRDQAHLVDIIARLRESGVDSLFVIAGDVPEPAGAFPDSLALLEALAALEHPFRTIGIGGYPEGHGSIDDQLIEQALKSKAPYADEVVTQLCFDAATTVRWASTVHTSGVTLPVRVGIPGAVNRQKLVRISAGLGLGQSARFLRKQQSMFWRFFLPGGYSPNRLIERLTPHFARPDNGLSGFHVFTFNELADTEKWRRDRLARLGES